MEALLGGHEIYHYHSKLMMKDPLTGGAFRWHQDYGYWLVQIDFKTQLNESGFGF